MLLILLKVYILGFCILWLHSANILAGYDKLSWLYNIIYLSKISIFKIVKEIKKVYGIDIKSHGIVGVSVIKQLKKQVIIKNYFTGLWY